MSIANYLETRILDAVFNNTSLAIAANYVKLHTGDPGEDCTANAAVNTTRQSASFGAASGNSVANDAAITWTSVPNAETYTHISIWDASTAGNALWSGALTASKVVAVGDTFSIAIGSLTVTVE